MKYFTNLIPHGSGLCAFSPEYPVPEPWAPFLVWSQVLLSWR